MELAIEYIANEIKTYESWYESAKEEQFEDPDYDVSKEIKIEKHLNLLKWIKDKIKQESTQSEAKLPDELLTQEVIDRMNTMARSERLRLQDEIAEAKEDGASELVEILEKEKALTAKVHELSKQIQFAYLT